MIMKRFPTMLGVLALMASSVAFAQTNSSGGNTAGQGAQQVQPGKTNDTMNRAANAGGGSPASGTLMQQREKGMSPQGASDSTSTGKMKQQ
jgi:hypothetical protein